MARSLVLLLALLGSLALAQPAHAARYRSAELWRTPKQFLSAFYADASPDKAGGTVTYTDADTATAGGFLGRGANGGLRFGVDASTARQGEVRRSVRLRSRREYADGLYVFDIAHAPVGCGTWPALWTVQEENWPSGGEIDIYEQVNGFTRPNSAALHTDAVCTMPPQRYMKGTSSGIDDCDSSNWKNGNAGCGVNFPAQTKSSGAPLNQNGGGVFALERNSATGIFIWYWPRSRAPKGTTGGVRGVLDPSTWGKPHAAFPKSASCSIKKRFAAHQIVMNVDVCGPYVEGFWQTDGCGAPNTCAQWSMDNPGAFNDAYFDLNQAGFWKRI